MFGARPRLDIDVACGRVFAVAGVVDRDLIRFVELELSRACEPRQAFARAALEFLLAVQDPPAPGFEEVLIRAETVDAVVARIDYVDVPRGFVDGHTAGLAELARAASGRAKALEEAVTACAERVGRLGHDEQQHRDERRNGERARPRRERPGPL